MKISYDDIAVISDPKTCNELRDSCFAVIDGLHIERISYYGAFQSGDPNKHTVCMYRAEECYVLTDGHKDFTGRDAFLAGFVFDTIEEANELFNFNVTSRVCDRTAHDEDLFNRYDVRF